jgi:hypothetical protein
VETGVAQQQPQREQDVALVVGDEHARHVDGHSDSTIKRRTAR